MYKDKELAFHLNELIGGACQLLDKGMSIVNASKKSGKCSDEEAKFYATRIGLLMGRELLEILEEIYWEHPELIPPGAQPWPRVEPRKVREREEKRLDMHRSETIVMLRLLWDVFRESHDRNIRHSAERLRKHLPPEKAEKKKKNKQEFSVRSQDSLKVQPITDVIEYYQDVVTLLEAHINELQARRESSPD